MENAVLYTDNQRSRTYSRKSPEVRGSRDQPNIFIMFHRSSRQPQSCQLCRGKKLRCDRERPCSNCKQRDVSCIYSSFHQKPAVALEAAAAATISHGVSPVTGVQDHQQTQMDLDDVESSPSEHRLVAIPSQADKLDDVVSRVQRLEQAVFLRGPPSYPLQRPDVSNHVRCPEFSLLESICAYFPLA